MNNNVFLLHFAISLLEIISTLAFCTVVFRKRFHLAHQTTAKLHEISWTPDRIEFAEPEIISGITYNGCISFVAYKIDIKLHVICRTKNQVQLSEPEIAQTGLFDNARTHQTD